MIKFNKKRNVFETQKLKELKPKDGYNRFKFSERIFHYKEKEIQMHGFSLADPVYGYVKTFDDDGNYYTVKFVLCYPSKWKPINIRQIKAVY